MSRAIFAATGVLLIAVAFMAASRVADTRQGLIAEIVTLIAGLAGVALLLYGLVPQRSASGPPQLQPRLRTEGRPRTANDLLLGAGGLVVAVLLLGRLALSAGWGWAVLGAGLLLPLLAGPADLAAVLPRRPARHGGSEL